MSDTASGEKRRDTWSEAWEEAKDEWEDAKGLDKRGLRLSRWFEAVFLWSVLLLTGSMLLLTGIETIEVETPGFDVWELTVAAAMVVITFWQWRFYSEGFPVYFVSKGRGAASAFSVAVASDFAGALAVAGALALALAGALAIAADITTVVDITGAVASAGAFSVTIAIATALAVAGAPALALFTLVRGLYQRAEQFWERAKREEERKATRSAPKPETGNPNRRSVRVQAESLLGRLDQCTAGFAGRRGLGKTNLLRLVNKENTAETLLKEAELDGTAALREARSDRLPLFVHCPSDFDERSFLMALLEQLALRVNRHLTALLPPVKPYPVERELREKRRILYVVHIFYLALGAALLLLGGFVSYSASPTFSRALPGLSVERTTPPAFEVLEDSLRERAQEQHHSLPAPFEDVDGDSLAAIVETNDSLARHVLPQMERLRQQEQRYKSTVIMQPSTSFADLSFFEKVFFGWFFAGLIGLPIWAAWIWYRTREGEVEFTRSVYQNVQDEVALYERTNQVLERIRYNLTVSEGKEVGASGGGLLGGFGLSRSRSTQQSRQERPFTVLGLVQEYREYATDVVQYLQRERPGFRIVICIDELDKVLDSDRLHEMLKSVKAVFEIPNVYYLLSISDDALGTYRLRHVQTKNEIDSAFTHIFTVPPMEADGSARFFLNHLQDFENSVDELVSIGVVLGGGVPRDMHRLTNRFAMHADEWRATGDPFIACLDAFWAEDRDAAADLLRQNPSLSDAWRHRWIQALASVDPRRLMGEDDPARAVQTWLDVLAAIDLDRFIRENVGTAEAARTTLHRTRSMLRGMAVKAFIYYRLHTDTSLHLPEAFDISDFLNASEEQPGETKHPPDVGAWLTALDPLRSGIFHLAEDPLSVWQTVRSDAPRRPE